MMAMTPCQREVGISVACRQVGVRATDGYGTGDSRLGVEFHSLRDNIEQVPIGQHKPTERGPKLGVEPFPGEERGGARRPSDLSE